jgi:glycosyltransferase involved in cell wall biosynthesis
MDLISVIVPIYNLDAYLYQCVSSIVQQTYKRLEIILVDDGSTDNAIEICEFFRKSDSRIQVIAKPNGGLVTARKAGLKASNGDYVYYVDGDDWIDADCIEQYYNYAREYSADIVIGNYKREFLGNFVTMRSALKPGFYDRKAIENKILPTMIFDGNFFNHGLKTYSWGKLYRRSVVEQLQINVPDEVMIAEDAALVYPAIYKAGSLFQADIVGCNYRQRPNSILKSTSFDLHEPLRIASAFSYLSSTLDAQTLNYNFLHQLRAYFAATMIIRTGGFLSEEANYRKYNLFGEIPRASRLALYNSGSFGQHVFKHLKASSCYQLVGWFDKDYLESQLLKMPVSDPKDIDACNFDYLVVPSFDSQVQAEVALLFDALNLPKSKIRTVNLDTTNFVDFIESTGFDATTFLPLQGAS